MATKVVEAVYQGGVFKPTEPVELKENSCVRVVIEEGVAAEVAVEEKWRAIREMVGFIKDGEEAFTGRDHDKYLYGR